MDKSYKILLFCIIMSTDVRVDSNMLLKYMFVCCLAPWIWIYGSELIDFFKHPCTLLINERQYICKSVTMK